MLGLAIGGVVVAVLAGLTLVWLQAKPRLFCNWGYHTWMEWNGKALCSNCLTKKAEGKISVAA